MRGNGARDGGVSGIVLAGGASRRMGRDKALLEIDGETLLARTIRVVGDVADEVIVVGRDDIGDIRTVRDVIHGVGPIGGLVTGLQEASNPYTIVVPVDHPLLDAETLRFLVELALDYDAVVPRVNGQVHPVHAVYAGRILPEIWGMVREKEYAVIRLLDRAKVRWVEEDELSRIPGALQSVQGVNTPEEWRELVAGERPRPTRSHISP